MYFVSPVLMEAKEFKNEPLPFVPKEEFSEMKSVIEHICKMMAVCLGEKDCNSLNSGCVTKHKFDYPYALTTVLHLIVKYFRYRFFSYRVSHKVFNRHKIDALFVFIASIWQYSLSTDLSQIHETEKGSCTNKAWPIQPMSRFLKNCQKRTF